MRKIYGVFSLILLLTLVLTGCSLGGAKEVQLPTIEPSATTAPTVPGPTSTPTQPLPTVPAVPSPVITVTSEMPAITAPATTAEVNMPAEATIITQSTTATLAAGVRPRVTPLQNTNCRVHPGRLTNVKGYFLVGMEAEIYAKNPTSEWVLIPNPDREKEFCWIWTGSVKITGSLDNVLVQEE